MAGGGDPPVHGITREEEQMAAIGLDLDHREDGAEGVRRVIDEGSHEMGLHRVALSNSLRVRLRLSSLMVIQVGGGRTIPPDSNSCRAREGENHSHWVVSPLAPSSLWGKKRRVSSSVKAAR